MLRQIEKLEEIDPATQEIISHHDFAEERARVFIGRQEILQRIDSYIRGPSSRPLLVYGPSGSGKSALMARALEHVSESHPQARIISRFIGATPSSTDIRSLLDGLCREIYKEFGFEELRRAAGPSSERSEDPYEIPSDTPKLSEASAGS